MKNMKTALALFLASTTLASARIGETPEQCAKRYGDQMQLHEDQFSYTKRTGGERRTTFIEFADGKAIRVKFAFKISPEGIQDILSVNGKEWKLVKPKAPMKTWKSSDGRQAVLLNSLSSALIIEDIAKVEAKKKSNEAKALEGF